MATYKKPDGRTSIIMGAVVQKVRATATSETPDGPPLDEITICVLDTNSVIKTLVCGGVFKSGQGLGVDIWPFPDETKSSDKPRIEPTVVHADGGCYFVISDGRCMRVATNPEMNDAIWLNHEMLLWIAERLDD